jgi:methionyl-tRNA formyltransferase
MENKLVIGLLVSGNLGFSVFEKLIKEYDINFVLTDRNSLHICKLADKENIAIFIGNPRVTKIKDFIRGRSINILLSVNYLFLIGQDLINLPSKMAINIHGSLLPKYRGRSPHVWAVINNEQYTGVTAHLIDQNCDTGPILKQISFPIEYNDTGALLLRKFEQLYYPLIKSVITEIQLDEYELVPQNDAFATFFGKRTPEDGKINWNWQKERIRNWVRAIAPPYPGAFCFVKKNKLYIDSIEFVDDGYTFEMPNGLILSSAPLLIKTPNGIVKVTEYRENGIELSPGLILI